MVSHTHTGNWWNRIELHVEDTWYRRTALARMLAVAVEKVNATRLYRTLDAILPLKSDIEIHLKQRVGELFSPDFDLLLHDVTTVEEIVEIMESKYGRARRLWVMDRGMVSEDNLQFLRDRGGLYLVGTPRPMLKKFQAYLLDSE